MTRWSSWALVLLFVCASGGAYAVGAIRRGSDRLRSDRDATTLPIHQASSNSAIVPNREGHPTDIYRDIQLEHDVSYHIEAYVGAAVMWISRDNPTIANGSIVRPVSIMAVATWKEERPVTRTHMLYWLDVSSSNALVASISALGSQFSDPDAPPRSRVSFEVRPKTNWGEVDTDADVVVTAELRPEDHIPQQAPQATPPTKK